ncbi:hypothetical protein BBP40_005161 [Aspergillus hancockii]|nr:hypothetical protein BBP40_005161 [Aspergillus hancockii]
MRFTISCLALIAAATSVVANDIVTIYVPLDSDSGDNSTSTINLSGKVVGINGSTTSYVFNCPTDATVTATPTATTASDDSSNTLACDMTFIQGPSSIQINYKDGVFERCDLGSKSATCYETIDYFSGSVTYSESVETDYYPITSTVVTITATDAAVTRSTPASTKASATAAASALSTGARHVYLAAGGAAMALVAAFA